MQRCKDFKIFSLGARCLGGGQPAQRRQEACRIKRSQRAPAEARDGRLRIAEAHCVKRSQFSLRPKRAKRSQSQYRQRPEIVPLENGQSVTTEPLRLGSGAGVDRSRANE